MLPTVEESRGYDFQDPENAEKWRGLFVNALRKVLETVHPTLSAEEGALQYVESLLLRLLAMLCAVPSPLTTQDVEERVARTFPTPLDRWALSDAREAANQKRRRQVLPLDKIHHMLQKEVLLYKIDMSVSIFITAILEYVSADILKLAGNFLKKISQKSGCDTLTSRDIKTAMCADKVLMDMFYQDSELALADTAAAAADRRRRGSLTYEELVRDLLIDERSFLRELNLIIRVFKDELEKIVDKDSQAISLIFANIVDIYELTVTLLGNLEDACEMAEDSPTPYIGSCFEELAEVEEFRAYVRYANVVTRRESRDALQTIVDDPLLAERLDTAGHGFRLAVKYYLPKLLLAPVGHIFLYHNYVLALLQIAPASEDRESFKQVECNLHPIKKLLMKALGNGPKMDATLRMATRARRQLAIEKCNELVRLVDNWDNRDIGQSCNEFIREDTLSKIGPGKRIAERRAYLFDGLLLLCKPITSLVSAVSVNMNSAGGGGAQQLKLKEKLHVRKVELVDHNDTDEGRHMLELCPRVGAPVVLACASSAEKRNWMCDLVMLSTKPMLDRTLDSILLDLERRHPLRLPPQRLYRFAVPDSPENLVLEARSAGSPVQLIKGATLLKLIERATHHSTSDVQLVRTFLTTYRSFCSPAELLGLLAERFAVPDAATVFCSEDNADGEAKSEANSEVEKLSKTAREDWKKYRKEYQQPVKFRVMNVIRHWVDQHFYDFERDPCLLQRLREFLTAIDDKPMRKWVGSVLKILDRKSQQAEVDTAGVSHVFDKSPPPVLKHVCDPERHNWHPLALHPVELARQLTLLEFQLYRQVRPSELVGAVWTKKDKETSSPNLLRIIKHTTRFTRWMEKWIVESECLEERAGVVARFLEVACALRDLNNFNGVLAVTSACESASVHRLKATFQLLPLRLSRALDEFRELNSDHFRRYQERLRSINPPCVPFFGMYLTNILHIEEGNLDFLSGTELINFSKRRKVAEITGEIQQYQNQPYCLTVEPATRAFLESLEPFPAMDDVEITNWLWAKSLEIEPRAPHNKQLHKIPRKYPELPLKLKSRRHHADSHTTSSAGANDDTLSVSQLSPTSNCTWDGTSVASLTFDATSRTCEDSRSLTSPRLERSSSHTSSLSLIDKGLALFNTTARSARDEPPSPRDRHSPRHHPSNPATNPSNPLNPSNPTPKALSPRGAIVDADLFYSRTPPPPALAQDNNKERVPPLLPRTSPSGPGNLPPPLVPTQAPPLVPPLAPPSVPPADERPPALPRRDTLPRDLSFNLLFSSEPPEPPERPLPSPKTHPAFRPPAMSPKRSPAPAPPSASPNADRVAFKFPSPCAPACASGVPPLPPPPLPPRRRRDSHSHSHSFSLAHTPSTINAQGVPEPTYSSAGVPGVPGASPGASSLPPPLPPRPPPAPELLRVDHSTILQRRHRHNSTAPRLPPKPPPAVAPRP